MTKPSLLIGVPVYQADAYLEEAINSLVVQSFHNWEMVIADNASTDRTSDIAKAFANRDQRIRYVRHERNVGAAANFLFLAGMATHPYFMWAAADDRWSPDYIERCMTVLKDHPAIGFASGRLVNTAPDGTALRDFGYFEGLETVSPRDRLSHFLAAREVDGKANIIYSIYRTPLIQAVCADAQIMTGWGADMGLVAAALSRAPYRQAEQAILYKGVASTEDIETARNLAQGRYESVDFAGNFPLRQFPSYLRALLRGMPSADLILLVTRIMLARLPHVVRWRLMRLLRRP
ncbi:MAG: glycosyltransferase family 2 protein [Candidatus Devosia phytovorans]|uniref:Glycosyltransferase family 2 protein n=1 Tax=Candidatus Devosia phytovorans TaxID=3121372 RepID=A0AAJ6B0S2_9HYPH|nr:glycosyltransferase family 2 protein [Devosia sp.]WEK03788.1 MAG: glycosyltransferase family 2 protein [Devosia sp.]